MILSRQHLLSLVNRLYEMGETSLPVSHPSPDIGELLRIDLDETPQATVEVTTGRYTYEERRDAVERQYGESAYNDLPEPQSYVRTLVAGGLFDVANRDAIETFLGRHGYPDLEAGHAPVMAGLDTNLFPYRMPAVLGLEAAGTRADRPDDRPPVTGFALSSGVREELDWHYKHYSTEELTRAFGDEFDRLTNQPAGENREGVLGLYQFRALESERQTDFVESATGDADIVDGYDQYQSEHRKSILLFSNDTGFVERATDAGLKAHRVAFPPEVGETTTIEWRTLPATLYAFAVVFGVITLPKATLYGVWNGKDGAHWENNEVAIDPRSPILQERLARDQRILRTYDDLTGP